MCKEKILKIDREPPHCAHTCTHASHGFSVELSSKNYINSISLSSARKERVLVEGTIGYMEELNILDGAVLQIKGSHGSIMVDLCEVKLRELLNKERKKNRFTGDTEEFSVYI